MSFLVGWALVTLEFVVTAQGFRVAKVLETACDGRVLLHVDAKVEKVFVLAGHSLTVQAPGLARQNALHTFKGIL